MIGVVIVFSDLSGSAKDGSSRQELSAAVDKQDPIIGVWHSEAGADLTLKDDGTAIMKQELSAIEIEGSWQKIDGEKYNIELVYIQDRETVENIGESGLGLNCPNCGAPLESLGAKVCRYCDTPVVEFNIKTWGFSSVKEV